MCRVALRSEAPSVDFPQAEPLARNDLFGPDLATLPSRSEAGCRFARRGFPLELASSPRIELSLDAQLQGLDTLNRLLQQNETWTHPRDTQPSQHVGWPKPVTLPSLALPPRTAASNDRNPERLRVVGRTPRVEDSVPVGADRAPARLCPDTRCRSAARAGLGVARSLPFEPKTSLPSEPPRRDPEGHGAKVPSVVCNPRLR